MVQLQSIVRENICMFVAGLGTAAVGAWLVQKSVRERLRQASLLKKAEKQRQQRDEGMEKLRHKLSTLLQGNPSNSQQWDKIVSLKFQDLREQLMLGKLSAVDVLHAYQWKALEAHEKTNCVTSFFHEAEVFAQELDRKYHNAETRPPLFGIPCSIKESIEVKGRISTCGMTSFLDNSPAHEDAVIVQSLKYLGAVPFVHTNLPQTMYSISSSNPVYGMTTNPYDHTRTPGGSSSGEGAIGALGGSVFGIGSDVGGSIRIPAHWCGIYGMKPTSSRISKWGCAAVMRGGAVVFSSLGPMGREVDTLATVLHHLWSYRSKNLTNDPYVPSIPFQENLYNEKRSLKIGYYYDNQYFEVTPACKRAVEKAKWKLEALGHKLVPWQPPDVPKVFRLHQAAVRIPDGGQFLRQALSKDILEPMNARYPHFSLSWIPVRLRHFLSLLLDKLGMVPRLSLYLSSPPKNTSQVRKMYEDIIKYRAEFTKLWISEELDGLICPVHACSAPQNDLPMQIFGASTYANLYNLLDYPAGTVPMTTVSSEDEKLTGDCYPVVVDSETCLVKGSFIAGSKGLPVGVQCATLPFKDELCLRLMKILEISNNI